MQTSKNNSTNAAIFGIYRLLLISFFIFTLYFAKTIIIPLTLAGLLTFLLSPLVSRLEKWIGRIFSILLIVIVVFSTTGFAAYVFTRQLIQFGSNFESYSQNIQTKLHSFQFPKGEIFDRMRHVLEDLKEELLGESKTFDSYTKNSSKFIDITSIFTNIAEWVSSSFFNLIGSTGIILLLVIFMLFKREDMRSRIIKLTGQNSISSTTSTMDDASERVYNYLFRQFVVNVGFGMCISTGLYFIGVPNAILWGCFAGVMRFIPYIGSWIATIIPIALSFIITDTWSLPLLTISFFIVLEMITAYVIEPLYYSEGTGVSSFALIFAAIFWTWLWGPIGLLLSTPLTVCLVVMGQHMTNLKFLSVLLSQEEALTPAEECYHRLLSFDSSASMEVIESYLKENSLISLYDSVLIPIITQTEVDFHQDLIDNEKKESIYQSIREIIEFLSLSEQKETPSIPEIKTKVLCLPARAIRDELGVNILAQLLVRELFEVNQASKQTISKMIELIENLNPDLICIAVIAPFVLSHARFLCAQLHQLKPQLPIVIGLWESLEITTETLSQFKSAGATKVVVSLAQTISALKEINA